MKTIATSAFIAFVGMSGLAAQANAVPADTQVHLAGTSSGQGPGDEGPARPGGKTHFPRNGMVHDGSSPTAGHNPRTGAPGVHDSVGAALGNGS